MKRQLLSFFYVTCCIAVCYACGKGADEIDDPNLPGPDTGSRTENVAGLIGGNYSLEYSCDSPYVTFSRTTEMEIVRLNDSTVKVSLSGVMISGNEMTLIANKLSVKRISNSIITVFSTGSALTGIDNIFIKIDSEKNVDGEMYVTYNGSSHKITFSGQPSENNGKDPEKPIEEILAETIVGFYNIKLDLESHTDYTQESMMVIEYDVDKNVNVFVDYLLVEGKETNLSFRKISLSGDPDNIEINFGGTSNGQYSELKGTLTNGTDLHLDVIYNSGKALYNLVISAEKTDSYTIVPELALYVENNYTSRVECVDDPTETFYGIVDISVKKVNRHAIDMVIKYLASDKFNYGLIELKRVELTKTDDGIEFNTASHTSLGKYKAQIHGLFDNNDGIEFAIKLESEENGTREFKMTGTSLTHPDIDYSLDIVGEGTYDCTIIKYDNYPANLIESYESQMNIEIEKNENDTFHITFKGLYDVFPQGIEFIVEDTEPILSTDFTYVYFSYSSLKHARWIIRPDDIVDRDTFLGELYWGRYLYPDIGRWSRMDMLFQSEESNFIVYQLKIASNRPVVPYF